MSNVHSLHRVERERLCWNQADWQEIGVVLEDLNLVLEGSMIMVDHCQVVHTET